MFNIITFFLVSSYFTKDHTVVNTQIHPVCKGTSGMQNYVYWPLKSATAYTMW